MYDEKVLENFLETEDYKALADETVENLKISIECMLYENRQLKEKIEEILQDREDNYRRLTCEEMYG